MHRQMQQRTDPDQPDVQETPVPPDAPVETPEADPRTEGAPDSGEADTAPDPADTTEELIQEAFE